MPTLKDKNIGSNPKSLNFKIVQAPKNNASGEVSIDDVHSESGKKVNPCKEILYPELDGPPLRSSDIEL
jgi:hypothetical protein